MCIYEQLLSRKRLQHTTIGNRSLSEEANSDRSRVIYSPPFRRLQEKAQVFPLEGNAAVRTRLTHTLEVADVGRLIAQKAADMLVDKGILSVSMVPPFVQISETACLMHDIGNPPFGHFGEAAIRKWFSDHYVEYYIQSRNIHDCSELATLDTLIKDFSGFDGNPQGIRTVTKLQWTRDRWGLNLTCTQILASLKYLRSTAESGSEGLYKKPGFFQSEVDTISRTREMLGIDADRRFPLTYIMEAADDIAYCISDIEDGVEKHIVDVAQIARELTEQLYEALNVHDLQQTDLPLWLQKSLNAMLDNDKDKGLAFFLFKTTFTREMIAKAAELYVSHHPEILEGKIPELFAKGTNERVLLDALKSVARKLLFQSNDAVQIELAGYSIIKGLLDNYACLLTCSGDSFRHLLDAGTNPSASKGLDVEWRLFHRLPEKHIQVYKDSIRYPDVNYQDLDPAREWFYRAHLITDYIAGMTDRFALDTFQILTGVSVG